MRLGALFPLESPAGCGPLAPKVYSSCLGRSPSSCPLRFCLAPAPALGPFRPKGHMDSQRLLVLGSCSISCWFPKIC